MMTLRGPCEARSRSSNVHLNFVSASGETSASGWLGLKHRAPVADHGERASARQRRTRQGRGELHRRVHAEAVVEIHREGERRVDLLRGLAGQADHEVHHQRHLLGVGALRRARDGTELELLTDHLGHDALHAALGTDAHRRHPPSHGLEVAWSQVVGAHPVGHVERDVEIARGLQELVEVPGVDVEQLVEHLEACRAVDAHQRFHLLAHPCGR
jgi:hypothetical protein